MLILYSIIGIFLTAGFFICIGAMEVDYDHEEIWGWSACILAILATISFVLALIEIIKMFC